MVYWRWLDVSVSSDAISCIVVESAGTGSDAGSLHLEFNMVI